MPPSQPQGLSYAEDAAEHENMKAVLKTSSPAVEDATPMLGIRTRSRASRGEPWWVGHVILGWPPWGVKSPLQGTDHCGQCVATKNHQPSWIVRANFSTHLPLPLTPYGCVSKSNNTPQKTPFCTQKLL